MQIDAIVRPSASSRINGGLAIRVMQLPIHILFVDDSPDDVEIACWRLSNAGILLTWERVQSQSGMMSALVVSPPHVIVSDNIMVGFDGWDAFRIAQELAPRVPFIFHWGMPHQDMCKRAEALGALGCADKDRGDELIQLVQSVVAQICKGENQGMNS